MSLPVLFLACDTCGESVPTGPYLSALYSIPDGKRLPLRWTLGWCNLCRRARRVEDWPSGENLDSNAASVVREWGACPDQLEGWKQEKLDDIETYRRLQPLRTTPNHCLDCGGTDLLPWSYNSEGELTVSPHGDCSGLFRQVEEDPDGMRFMLVDESDLYSINGTGLGRVPNDSTVPSGPTIDDVDGLDLSFDSKF
ncbi:MAG: hypothetical protein ACK8QZ_06430 [Anaerolineales bacterium]